jgi:stearoyl-CoA desaturase (delta-9 desaturase)
MNDFDRLRLLLLIVHVCAAVGVVMYWEPAWLMLTVVAHFCFNWLGQELYCHRYLSHRSFELATGWQRLFLVFSIFNLFGTPLGIAGSHISHHKYADTDKDPHPSKDGWKTWFFFHKYPFHPVNMKYVKQMLADPWVAFVTRHYFKLYLVPIVLFAFIDLRIVIYGFLLNVVLSLTSVGLINVGCHKFGYRRYDTQDTSRNNWGINALMLFNGAANHNTHHAHPGRWYTAEKWWELDGVGRIISWIKK